MTHSYATHDSFLCVLDLTRSYVRHHSFMRETRLISIRDTWLIHTQHMTHSSSNPHRFGQVENYISVCGPWLIPICGSWLIHKRDMTHLYVTHDYLYATHDSFIIESTSFGSSRKLHICMWTMTRLHVWYVASIRETWLIPVCGTWPIDTRNLTHLYMGHDSSTCGTWLIYVWDMTHLYARTTQSYM